MDEYIVKQVFEGSKGAEGGVQAGDVIRRINWVPHFFLNIGVINRIVTAKEGKKIKEIGSLYYTVKKSTNKNSNFSRKYPHPRRPRQIESVGSENDDYASLA